MYKQAIVSLSAGELTNGDVVWHVDAVSFSLIILVSGDIVYRVDRAELEQAHSSSHIFHTKMIVDLAMHPVAVKTRVLNRMKR